MIKDKIIGSILIGFFGLLLVAAVWYLIRKSDETYEEVEQEVPSELLQHIAEYRSYMVNQWICLLAFWFNIKPEDAQTKLLCPSPNQNAVYFFHENIEVYAFFNWNDNTMEVKTIKNLYFAGEVLDIDGFTGGFNLQAAFSTGFLAGQSVIDH